MYVQLTYLLFKMYRRYALLLLHYFLYLSHSTSEDLWYTLPCIFVHLGLGDMHKVGYAQNES